MTDSDIVVRLRQGWLAHLDTDLPFVMVYASEWRRLTNLTTESADEIERLRAERDEARREVCQLMRADDYIEPFDGTVFEYASHRGWDCFKEVTDERHC